MIGKWFAIPLWQRVIGALVLGVVLGVLWGPGAESIKWIGDLFISAVKMLVIPLIFFTLVSGVAALGNLNRLGAIGVRALGLFIATGLAAVTIGLALGTIFQPGAGLNLSLPEGAVIPEAQHTSASDMLLAMIPDNPVAAMAEGQILPVIVFALLFGISLLLAKEEGAPLVRGFDAGAIVMQKMTMIVMELTPLGVFALMAWVAGSYGLSALKPLATLIILNYVGCFLVIFGVYAFILKFVARLPLSDFYRGVIDAQAVAFSTASSNATLPVTLRCVQRNLGVSKSVSGFTISLGATVNMDGTAMYLGLVAMFGAQLYGIDLGVGSYVVIALAATLGSVGVAGIPGGGLVMMGFVLGAAGIPLETIAFVAGVNHIMDMMRTATNVTGDSTVAVTVAKLAGEIDIAEYESDIDV